MLSKLKLSNCGISSGLKEWEGEGRALKITSPVDGELIGVVREASKSDYENIVEQAQSAFVEWRMMPAPHRGEIVRQMGDALREYKSDLGSLVSYEMGKSLQEGLGEVQ